MNVGASTNGNGGVYRLTPAETAARLEVDGAPISTLVDKDSKSIVGSTGLRVIAAEPVTAATVSLPVFSTAALLAFRADGEATAASIRADYRRKRVGVERELAHELATLGVRRSAVDEAREAVAEALATKDEFVRSLPRRFRRRLGRRPSRLGKAVPWVMFAADAMFLSRAYGLLGPLPLPFRESVSLTNTTQLLRAAAVSFGLTFGLKMVGGKLREVVEELRGRRPVIGGTCDVIVGGLVMATAVRLMVATSALQKALIDIVTGGTTVNVPASVFLAIVAFLGSVSLAAGYYLAEPEIDSGADLETRVDDAKSTLRDAVRACLTQLGVVRAVRARLGGLTDEEAYELVENEAHTDRRVYAHMAGNVELYGLEIPASTSSAGAA